MPIRSNPRSSGIAAGIGTSSVTADMLSSPPGTEIEGRPVTPADINVTPVMPGSGCHSAKLKQPRRGSSPTRSAASFKGGRHRGPRTALNSEAARKYDNEVPVSTIPVSSDELEPIESGSHK